MGQSKRPSVSMLGDGDAGFVVETTPPSERSSGAPV
jgi:hypothetical protein